jgi:hypothetical protein
MQMGMSAPPYHIIVIIVIIIIIILFKHLDSDGQSLIVLLL